MFKHILVPIDETQLSMLVIGQAIELAALHGARISFLHLSPDAGGLVDGDAGLLHAMAPELFARKYLWRDGYIRAKALGWAQTAQVETAFVGAVEQGPLHSQILHAAEVEGADLILMGSHWRGSLLERIFGSVSVKLLLNTRLPVLISPAGPDELSPRNVVIAQFREMHAVWISLLDRLLGWLDAESEGSDDLSLRLQQGLALQARIADEVHAILMQPPFVDDLPARQQADRFFADLKAYREALEQCWQNSAAGDSAALVDALQQLRHCLIERVVEENNRLLQQAEAQADADNWTRAAQIIDSEHWRSRREQLRAELSALLVHQPH